MKIQFKIDKDIETVMPCSQSKSCDSPTSWAAEK